MDWASRRILAWRVSITLTTDFCLEAVEEALAKHGRSAIFNAIQGSQFTSAYFKDLLKAQWIATSMDSKGCWRDNVFVERFWKSIKYEAVYLHAYDKGSKARGGTGRYIDFYNERRAHRALDGDTPESVYFTSPPLPLAA